MVVSGTLQRLIHHLVQVFRHVFTQGFFNTSQLLKHPIPHRGHIAFINGVEFQFDIGNQVTGRALIGEADFLIVSRHKQHPLKTSNFNTPDMIPSSTMG
jgi:hypothetical protein